MNIPAISVAELNKRRNEFSIIDVRRADEFNAELGHIDGAVLVTLGAELEAHLKTLPKDGAYVFVCRSGGRSGTATEVALSKGFLNVLNMTGGMMAWNAAGYGVVR